MNLYDADVCDDLEADENEEALQKVHEHVSKWSFYTQLGSMIPTLLVIALYGSWSDHISRKVPIMIVLFGKVVSVAIQLLNAVYIDKSPGFLLVGGIVYGLTGGYSVFLVVIFSYLGEVTSEESRTTRMALGYAVQTSALIVSSASSGVALDQLGFIFVFSFALLVGVINILYTIVTITDIKPEDRDKGSEESVNKTGLRVTVLQPESSRVDLQTEHEMTADIGNAGSEQFRRPVNDTNAHVPFSQLSWKHKLAELFSLRHFKDSFLITFKKRQGDIRKCIILITLILFTTLVTQCT